MKSRKFIHFATVAVILLALTASSSPSTLTFDDGNVLDIPDDPKIYCGIHLRKAVRSFCREKVIKTYKKLEPPRGFQKPSRCGGNLIDHCCKISCDIPTFVKYCPYRYIRR